jgi:histidyl-tRNA synthetase
MVPEKGRNTGVALERELASEPYDVTWLRDIINGRGKRAAKTGVGFEDLAEQVHRIREAGKGGRDGALQLGLKHFGRLESRPVFESLELTRKTLQGYESPSDAWQGDCARFYAGFDVLVEDLLWEGADVELASGFETAIGAAMAERGYELVDTTGSRVRWAIMHRSAPIPEEPRLVLLPEEFPRLGRALAARYWGRELPESAFETYESYAKRHDDAGADEEALLAEAPAGVTGVYMYVSGSTADEHGLAYEQVPGATSELGVFERTTDSDMTNVTNLKGFYDRFPDEFAAWREVIDVVESTAAEFGFREIDTPAVERTELYEVKSGDELLDQTYSFDDRGGRRVTLTPEQTPTRARMVQERKDLSTPIKWYDTSKRWRYENVQKGRDREFFQTDIDVFGIESVAADAEVIACGATIYRKLGVADAVEFLINDRTLLESLLEAEGIENTVEVMRVIDDKEKLSASEFHEALADRGVTGADADRVDRLTSISGPIAGTIDELREQAPDDAAAEAAVERMADLADALESHGVASTCRLDLSIVRGLAYYTGLVFEAFDAEGELRALFGGGRYDDLVGLFGGREVPAVGFAFGYSTTRELLVREGAWPDESVSTDVYVATVSDSVRDRGLAFARDLRAAGLVVETDLAGRSLGSQLGYADTIDAAITLIVGERDLAEGVITVRDMASGDEEAVPVDEVTADVTARVGWDA